LSVTLGPEPTEAASRSVPCVMSRAMRKVTWSGDSERIRNFVTTPLTGAFCSCGSADGNWKPTRVHGLGNCGHWPDGTLGPVFGSSVSGLPNDVAAWPAAGVARAPRRGAGDG